MSEPYEFDGEQNKTIEKLARSMKTVGIVMMVFGVLGLASVGVAVINGGVNALNGVFSSLFLAVFGFWTRRAGHSFDAVVRTSGSDVTHLMSALGDLSKMYGVIRAIIVLMVCFFLAFCIVMVIGGVWGMASRH